MKEYLKSFFVRAFEINMKRDWVKEHKAKVKIAKKVVNKNYAANKFNDGCI